MARKYENAAERRGAANLRKSNWRKQSTYSTVKLRWTYISQGGERCTCESHPVSIGVARKEHQQWLAERGYNATDCLKCEIVRADAPTAGLVILPSQEVLALPPVRTETEPAIPLADCYPRITLEAIERADDAVKFAIACIDSLDLALDPSLDIDLIAA